METGKKKGGFLKGLLWLALGGGAVWGIWYGTRAYYKAHPEKLA